MKVYVLSEGEYEDHGIFGIYSTLEKAMGAAPNMDWSKVSWTENRWVATCRVDELSYSYEQCWDVQAWEVDAAPD